MRGSGEPVAIMQPLLFQHCGCVFQALGYAFQQLECLFQPLEQRISTAPDIFIARMKELFRPCETTFFFTTLLKETCPAKEREMRDTAGIQAILPTGLWGNSAPENKVCDRKLLYLAKKPYFSVVFHEPENV